MKSFRSTLIVAVVALGLGVYSYFEYEKGKEKELSVGKEGRLYPDLETDHLSSFEIKSPAHSLTLRKADGTWRLEVPVADLADQGAVESFLNSFLSESVKELDLGKDSVDLGRYGFSDKSPVVTFITGDGKTVSVMVSDQEAYDGSRYVKKGDAPTVFVGSREWKTLTTKKPTDLRDKLIAADFKTADKFVVKRKGEKPIAFEKVEGKWTFTSDRELRLDANVIDSYLSNIQNVRVQDFVSEVKDGEALKRFGLDQPDGEVEIGDQKISYSVKGQDLYLVRSGRDVIYRAPLFEREKWSKDLGHFRDKKAPFQFDAEGVTELQFRSPNLKLSLKKEESGWKSTDAKEIKAIDEDVLNALIESLARLEAKSFSGKDGIKVDRFANHVAILGKQGEKLFTMGWEGKSKDKDGVDVYKVKTIQSPEFLTVEASRLDALQWAQLMKSPEAEAAPADDHGTDMATPEQMPESKVQKQVR